MELPAGTVADRYTVEARLGAGGMAVVYRVRHNVLGSSHAMKVLTVPMPTVRQRLIQEGRVQSSLVHPNIVPVTDVVAIGDMPALVMEYVRGPSLDAYLSRSRPTLEQADDLARGILRGVGAAHRHGLIHRDLKPANILLAITDHGPVPKITDFGLVKILAGEQGGSLSQTRSGMRMGTPPYMAPEQIRDTKGVDARADIFSLGAVLYELLTGRRCFEGADILEVYMAICGGQYVDPRELVPDAPERMVEAIAGALQVDVSKRTANCEQLLAIWTGGKTVSTWDAAALEEVEALGSGSRDVSSFGPPASEMTYVLPLTAALPNMAPEEVAKADSIAAGEFAMGLRRVTLTGGYELAKEPVKQAVWQSIMNENPSAHADPNGPVERVSWHEVLEFCNRASAATGLDPVYAFGPFEPRKQYSLDDVGRMLYDLVPFAQITGLLAHFGLETLHVLQFEPGRLVEVDGIGPSMVAEFARAWDPYRYYDRSVGWIEGAGGFRLPTEAEWARSATGSPIWEWIWDADLGPNAAAEPRPLPEEPAIDPAESAGSRRIVRRRGDARRCREPGTRAPDLGFRVARFSPG